MTITDDGVTMVTGDEARLLGGIVSAELGLAANPLIAYRGAGTCSLDDVIVEAAAAVPGRDRRVVTDCLERNGAW